MSPQGPLCVWSGNDLDHDDIGTWMLKNLSYGCTVATASLLADIHLAKVTALAGELMGPKALSEGSKHDVPQSA